MAAVLHLWPRVDGRGGALDTERGQHPGNLVNYRWQLTTRRVVHASLAVILASLGIAATGPTAHAATPPAGECAPGNVAYSADAPEALAMLQSEALGNRATGAGIIVAVIDSGVDANNAHLRDAVIGGINLVGDGENSQGLSDLDGHGTAIAGQIAARQIPESGVIGLAPAAQILSVRVYRGTDDESVKAGFGPTSERLAAGIRYAVDNGARIINVSLSNSSDSPALGAAVDYAVANGSLIVASAGNRATAEVKSDGARYPAAHAGALAVTAVDSRGLATEDSIHGAHIDVAAPGSQILTSSTGAGDCLYAGEVPSSSFATAYVSAAAAAVAQVYPSETPAQWEYRLLATALRENPDARDDLVGWGIIQPLDAVTLYPDASTRGPASAFFSDSTGAMQAEPVTLAPANAASDSLGAQQLMVVAGVAGLTILGTLAVIIVFRNRRRPTSELPPPASGGLLNRKKP
ncbi:S8 family serine peptidase [Salinibacterium sp. PAMC 21357]|uniref:S8 family serine peptidase n=1 Tax=Salinibacterium sp. PAMC 21357 TaxID=1112215 RepID=UPI000289BE5E|nr:S8 family serine peptidase [Salinibacterium sp. PAMC 21357]